MLLVVFSVTTVIGVFNVSRYTKKNLFNQKIFVDYKVLGNQCENCADMDIVDC